MSIKEACECLYILDINPCSIDLFVDLFCRKYELIKREEKVKIRGMLKALQNKGIIEVRDDYLFFHNTLSSNIKLNIIG